MLQGVQYFLGNKEVGLSYPSLVRVVGRKVHLNLTCKKSDETWTDVGFLSD